MLSASTGPRAAPRRCPTHTTEHGHSAAESPLAWLASRKDKAGRPLLSEVEFAAGEKLRADFWFAEMTLRVTANWSLLLGGGGGQRGAPDIGPDIRDSIIAARERVGRALAAVGPDLAGVLIDVCCFLKGLEASERASGPMGVVPRRPEGLGTGGELEPAMLAPVVTCRPHAPEPREAYVRAVGIPLEGSVDIIFFGLVGGRRPQKVIATGSPG